MANSTACLNSWMSFPNQPGYAFGACNLGGRHPSHETGWIELFDHKFAFIVVETWECNRRAELINRLASLLLDNSPAASLNSLNNTLCESNQEMNGPCHPMQIICVWLMVLNCSGHSIETATAGFQGPEIRTANNELISPDHRKEGVPLGIIPSFPFETQTIELSPGESAIWIAPNTTQVMNSANELYGFRFRERVKAAPFDATCIVELMVKDLREYIGGCEQREDICILCVRRID